MCYIRRYNLLNTCENNIRSYVNIFDEIIIGTENVDPVRPDPVNEESTVYLTLEVETVNEFWQSYGQSLSGGLVGTGKQ